MGCQIGHLSQRNSEQWHFECHTSMGEHDRKVHGVTINKCTVFGVLLHRPTCSPNSQKLIVTLNQTKMLVNIQNDDILPSFCQHPSGDCRVNVSVGFFLLCVQQGRCDVRVNPFNFASSNSKTADSAPIWRSWSFIYWHLRFLNNTNNTAGLLTS